MTERGEIKAIRIGKKKLRIPSSELERYLEGEPTTDPEAASLEENLLVVADPDSRSGKTTKAREYGVRIVAETASWSMIGAEVS